MQALQAATAWLSFHHALPDTAELVQGKPGAHPVLVRLLCPVPVLKASRLNLALREL